MAVSTDEMWCAQLGQQGGEPVQASAATGVERWLLVEVHGRWGAKPPADSGFDAAHEKRLRQALKRCPGLRLQLIRRPGQDPEAPQVWVCDRKGAVAIDWASFCRADVETLTRLFEQPTEAASLSAPWYLVCTHGTRDRCCAKYGQTLYAQLEAMPRLRGRVWQTSHLGGHRFAPTLVTLPSGLCYGRVQSDDVEALVAATEAGRVGQAAILRGPCHEDRAGQHAWCAAAEHWPGFAWRELEVNPGAQAGPGEPPSVQCTLPARGHSMRVELRTGQPLEVLKSCGDGKRKAVAPTIARVVD